MDTDMPGNVSLPAIAADVITRRDLSRRGFLRTAAIAGGGAIAAGLAACAPAAGPPAFTFPVPASSGGPNAAGPSAGSSASPDGAAPGASHDHGSAPPSSGPATDHDAAALAVVKRFLDGEYSKVAGAGNQPISPHLEGGVKVFDFSVDKISHRIDAVNAPLDALGFNGTWPGPRIDVTEGDRVRAIFRNNLDETTGIHFHGQRIPNNMDGVPRITQDPIKPGESFTYEFVARTVGSHMYHSHHNATDQVGRGLLGAFIVHPRDESRDYDQLYGVTQDIVWISNDTLGGFKINGRGFPATARSSRRSARRSSCGS
jgi:FtsP/CotA-like multicopper oxidase with cupredoxin domain